MLIEAKGLCFQLPDDVCHAEWCWLQQKKIWVQFKTTLLKLVHTFQQTALKCFQKLIIKYLF